VKDMAVYSIMTGSGYFEDHLSPIFSSVAEPRDIHLLSREDAVDLIRKPVEEFLEYSDEAVQRIYRLSGGYLFLFSMYVRRL